MHKDLFSSITELAHFIRIKEKPPIGRRFPVPRLEQCSNNLERIQMTMDYLEVSQKK
jgi:hypothetical protein